MSKIDELNAEQRKVYARKLFWHIRLKRTPAVLAALERMKIG